MGQEGVFLELCDITAFHCLWTVFMLTLQVLEMMRSRHPDVIIMWDMMLTMDRLRLSSLLNYDVGRSYFYGTAPLGLVNCSPTAFTAHIQCLTSTGDYYMLFLFKLNFKGNPSKE